MKLAQLKREAAAVQARIADLRPPSRMRRSVAERRARVAPPTVGGGAVTIAPLSAATGAAPTARRRAESWGPARSWRGCSRSSTRSRTRLAQIRARHQGTANRDRGGGYKRGQNRDRAAELRPQENRNREARGNARLTKCPPNCTGGATGKPKTDAKIAKPIAASGGGGGSRLLSPSLLDGGAGLSGGNTTVRGSPAGGMTSSPGPGRATVR